MTFILNEHIHIHHCTLYPSISIRILPPSDYTLHLSIVSRKASEFVAMDQFALLTSRPNEDKTGQASNYMQECE